MAGIPRFETQVQQISIPSMKNFQEQQNESIYRSLASFAETTTNIAQDMYVKQKQYEAEVQGAEDVQKAKKAGENFDLSSLPAPITQAQRIYNESAINAYAAQFNVDNSLALSNLKEQNSDNPDMFLSKAQSYIGGVSSTIPDHLKASIVKPIEKEAISIYNTLLNKKATETKKANEDMIKISIKELAREAANEDDPELQDQKIANVMAISTNAVATGQMTADAFDKEMTELRKNVATKRLSQKFLSEKLTPKQMQQTINKAMLGDVGILAFNSLSPDERAEAVKNALDKIGYTQRYLGEVAESKQKYVMAESMIKSFDKIVSDKNLTEDDMKKISWGNSTLKKMAVEQRSDVKKVSVPKMITDMNAKVQDSTLTEEQIIKAYDEGYIDSKDAQIKLNEVISPLFVNKKKEGYKNVVDDLNIQMPDVKNEIGEISQKNNKKDYILKNLDAYLSTAERTDEEIRLYAEQLQEKANKNFKTEKEYTKLYTPSWFKEKTGYNLSAIDDVVARSTINGNVDMKKLRSELLKLTGNNKDIVNKIYSFYKAVKEQ